MSDTVAACPECDTARLTRSAGGGRNGRSEQPRGTYRCSNCGSFVDEFIERPPKHTGGGRRGLAGRLEAADPEEVTR